jgi:hypothetical protein
MIKTKWKQQLNGQKHFLKKMKFVQSNNLFSNLQQRFTSLCFIYPFDQVQVSFIFFLINDRQEQVRGPDVPLYGPAKHPLFFSYIAGPCLLILFFIFSQKFSRGGSQQGDKTFLPYRGHAAAGVLPFYPRRLQRSVPLVSFKTRPPSSPSLKPSQSPLPWPPHCSNPLSPPPTAHLAWPLL